MHILFKLLIVLAFAYLSKTTKYKFLIPITLFQFLELLRSAFSDNIIINTYSHAITVFQLILVLIAVIMFFINNPLKK